MRCAGVLRLDVARAIVENRRIKGTDPENVALKEGAADFGKLGDFRMQVLERPAAEEDTIPEAFDMYVIRGKIFSLTSRSPLFAIVVRRVGNACSEAHEFIERYLDAFALLAGDSDRITQF